jgi:hypothetical protein
MCVVTVCGTTRGVGNSLFLRCAWFVLRDARCRVGCALFANDVVRCARRLMRFVCGALRVVRGGGGRRW